MERIIGRKITDRCTLKATKDHDNANKVVQDPKLAEQRLTKNGNKAYYYKHSKKWQRKHRSPFMRLSKEVKLNIFKQACEGVTMIDKTRAPTGDFRRKFGLQNLAFVCKSFKAVFEEAFFELCTFKLHHYRLHPKHHHRNPMKTLHRIQNLQILWEPRSRSKITTSQLSVDTVMSLEKLRVITIDLVALPVERVGLSNGNIELHENILRNFNGRIGALPKWARDLMINSGKVSVLLQYYFTATTTELMGLTANDQQIQVRIVNILSGWNFC